MPATLEVFDKNGALVFSSAAIRVPRFLGLFEVTWVFDKYIYDYRGTRISQFKGTLPFTWSFATHIVSMNVLASDNADMASRFDSLRRNGALPSVQDGYLLGTHRHSSSVADSVVLEAFKSGTIKGVAVYKY